MPTSITTGAGWPSAVVTIDTTIIRDLELDSDGTSWTGVCNNAQANVSLSGNNSFITVTSTNVVRIVPTLVAHVAT